MCQYIYISICATDMIFSSQLVCLSRRPSIAVHGSYCSHWLNCERGRQLPLHWWEWDSASVSFLCALPMGLAYKKLLLAVFRRCWLNPSNYFIWAFISPVVAIIIVSYGCSLSEWEQQSVVSIKCKSHFTFMQEGERERENTRISTFLSVMYCFFFSQRQM